MIAKKKILVIDDDPEVNDLISNLLISQGHEPIQVDSAEAGLDYLNSQSADLIIIDVILPSMDGWQLARVIRNDSRIKFVPIIMLTGSPTPMLDRMAEEVGANACLLKPMLGDKLEALVSRFLADQGNLGF